MSQILNNIYDNITFALNLNAEAMARMQEQASTGARVNRPSDDPSAACNILQLNSQQRSLDTYTRRLDDLVSMLEFSTKVVSDITSQVTEAKKQLTQIANGIYSSGQRSVAAEGIDSILEHLVSLANTKNMNQYIFGGSNTNSPPYVVERTDGKITAVTYQGSQDSRIVEVAPGVQTAAFSIGDNILSADQRGDPLFFGNTGAKPGTGTSSVRGDVWLTVDNDGSNYRLSIDDGETWTIVPSGGDSNQAVTDPRTARVLYVDTTELTATGTELVRVPGTADIFSLLINIRGMLTNERNLSAQQWSQYQNELFSSMDDIENRIAQAQISLGLKTGYLDNLKNSLTTASYDAQDHATQLQQADIAQVAVELSRRQTLYQMSLSVAAKVMSMSLLDFIQ